MVFLKVRHLGILFFFSFCYGSWYNVGLRHAFKLTVSLTQQMKLANKIVPL